MKKIFEYGEDEWDDEEEIPDEEDEIRQEILEAEANEIWLEDPADENDEEPRLPNPLPGMSSFPGNLPFPGSIPGEKENEA